MWGCLIVGRVGVAARVSNCTLSSQSNLSKRLIRLKLVVVASVYLPFPTLPLSPSLAHALNALNNLVTVTSFCNTNIIALNMDRCNEALPALKWKGAWAVEGAMRGRGRGNWHAFTLSWARQKAVREWSSRLKDTL